MDSHFADLIDLLQIKLDIIDEFRDSKQEELLAITNMREFA